MDNAPNIGIERWHQRFVQQAGWTAQVRGYLDNLLGLSGSKRILEVGCGSGAITSRFAQQGQSEVHGLDLSLPFLRKAAADGDEVSYTCGDAYNLPYPQASFEACVCHFLLLWLAQPVKALNEMKRVTRPGGHVVIYAEPDHAARIDYPPGLESLGQYQTEALAAQGANPRMGRTAAHLLQQAGCRNVHIGLMGGQWNPQSDPTQTRLEQEMIQADLEGRIPADRIAELLLLDQQAWKTGYRVLFVPTFYAWGVA